MDLKMILILAFASLTLVHAEFAGFTDLKSYARIFKLDGLLANDTGNELWHGLFRDCDKKVTFSCIQKNAYTYLDNVFVERDNITVFEGLVLTKNKLDYGTCSRSDGEQDVDDNLVEGAGKSECAEDQDEKESDAKEGGRKFSEDPETPLEEVTGALRKKTLKFLATRDYEIQLPEFYFEGATIKVSPREVDESGALLRVDFGHREVASQGRLFKKIRKFIQNKLLTSFLALMLIIKLIKLKFMFVIPFLFGVGTAKKLFLKLLLFFVPAFAHIFKLCSSYYSAHSTKYHHHHHQIAHHHHHVPVPVPVPAYNDHHHHHHHEEEFDGYDYAHPHIQYRKDVEELKEWGIEPYEEPYDDQHPNVLSANRAPGVVQAPPNVPGVVPGIMPGPAYPGPYGISQYAPNVRPLMSTYPEKRPVANPHAHNLAYSAYLDDGKYNRRTVLQGPAAAPSVAGVPVVGVPVNPTNVAAPTGPTINNVRNPMYAVYTGQNVRQVQTQPQKAPTKASPPVQRAGYDDEYYGPIIARLDEIFSQLRFHDENCRERLVCSMYKSPSVYAPHSNLISNELSRDPQELKRATAETTSSRKFHRYVGAARLGQDGGDCLRTYPCHINTE